MSSGENTVLCAANAYEQKFYLNPAFDRLPEQVKQELQIMCVLFTEEIGGILSLEFDQEGSLLFQSAADEGDLFYDDIGCGLKINQLIRDKQQLLYQLELYYKAVVLGKTVFEDTGEGFTTC